MNPANLLRNWLAGFLLGRLHTRYQRCQAWAPETEYNRRNPEEKGRKQTEYNRQNSEEKESKQMAYYRREYHIYGRVQGVGFRYTVRYLARSMGLTGWVRNEYDGSVTLTLQGKSKEDFRFVISQLDQDRYIRIEGIEFKDIEPEEDERSFTVRH